MKKLESANRLLTEVLLWIYWTVILAAVMLVLPVVFLWTLMEEPESSYWKKGPRDEKRAM